MCRSGSHHLENIARGSHLALVFEAVQWCPSITFLENLHDYTDQYFGSFDPRICLPDSSKWRYRQNYDRNNWLVWIREAFLGRISASSGPQTNDIFGKTWQTFLPPCEHGHFVSKFRSLAAAKAAYRYRFFNIDTNTDTTFRYQYEFDPYCDIYITILSRVRLFCTEKWRTAIKSTTHSPLQLPVQ